MTGVVDDFVVRRNDGAYAYNLAVVVDDAAQGIGEVVRGADLLDSTPRQLWLGERLGLPAPRHAHVPLMLGDDGARLAKRHGAVTLADRAALGETAGRRAGAARRLRRAERAGRGGRARRARRALLARRPGPDGGGGAMRMGLVRIWLPVAIVAGGLIVIVATGGSETGVEGGAGIIGAGLSVWLLNVIFRVGVQGERERDAEDEARDFYGAHGYWPDEAPPPDPAEPAPEPEHPTSTAVSPPIRTVRPPDRARRRAVRPAARSIAPSWPPSTPP